MAGLWWEPRRLEPAQQYHMRRDSFRSGLHRSMFYYGNFVLEKVDIYLDLIKLVSHFSNRWIFEFSQTAIWASGGLGLHYNREP